MRTRREFLRTTGLYTAGFLGLRALAGCTLFGADANPAGTGFGPLLDDVAGRLRLPRGFRYMLFSSMGDEMDDGLLVPGRHDGMAAFARPGGRTLLVRNHELESAWSNYSPFGPDGSQLKKIPRKKLYDFGRGVAPNLGGTTTLVFETRTQKLERHFLSLAGTVRNCAGGVTPWGTLVTCEEVNLEPEPHAEQPHGFNFEVRPTANVKLADPIALKAMGRFRHEAIAVEPRSGVVYQTEDLADGLLYRFIPKKPKRLTAGGRLQALRLSGEGSMDTRNWESRTFPVGQPLPVSWLDLEDVEDPAGDLRLRGAARGAAVFARGEGAWYNDGEVYFAMTNGGTAKLGQIFRYRPSPHEGRTSESEHPGTLELFSEPNDSALLTNCDNLTVAPWGDLIICEDHDGACRVIGVTPRGGYYVLAESVELKRELAGACFSPDGTTLFVNVQNPGYTVAITGPLPARANAG